MVVYVAREVVINGRIRHATKTESSWSSSNPILKKGEIAFSSDRNNMYKVGDGSTAWSGLSYNTALSATTLDGLTATVSELNKLDGVTASTAEINKLKGLTATTAELNKLAGLGTTKEELSHLVGVTSGIQNQLNEKALDSDLDNHVNNTDIHVTTANKEAWNNNKDTVKQTKSVSNASYPLLLGSTTNPNGASQSTIYGEGITANPSNSTITAASFDGIATSATKLTSTSVGAQNKPVFFSNGVPTAFSSTIGSENEPVYVANGVITKCGDTLNVDIEGNAKTATTATTADKTAKSLTISLNGTSQGAWDGSSAKSIDVTPEAIRALPITGGTLTGKLQIGESDQATAPGTGIAVHDLRNATITPNSFGDQSANFYFDQINGGWKSVLHVKGWNGNYSAWELYGNASETSNNTLYYRQGFGDSWQPAKTIAFTDSSITGNAATATKVYGTLTNPSASTEYYIPFYSGSATGNKSLLHNNGFRYTSKEGTTSALGAAELYLGNATPSTNAANKVGKIFLYGESSGYSSLSTANATGEDYNSYLPAADSYLTYIPSQAAVGATNKPVYVDATGKITVGSYELNKTVPSNAVFTDTKNTAGSTDSSSKLFLVGATSQAANPQTYSHDTAYVGTDGHLYSNSKQVVNLSDTQALTNKTYNGYTLAAACAKGVTDSTAAGAIGTGTNLVTERDVYYGLPTINNAHNYTSSTTIYAPSASGTANQALVSSGTGKAPVWTDQSNLSVGSAATWSTARNFTIKDADSTNSGTAASVDGSGAVTLLLPSTIKATLSGNASSATKATKDSADQQINTTYIKGLSVSGKTITYTKGDNTTGTITTQDTTYSNATQSAAGLLSATDKKYLDSVRGSHNLGNMSGKKGSDLQTALDTWLASYYNIPNATAYFSAAADWITAWNGTSSITAGQQWQVTVVAHYSTKAYVQLRIATYTEKLVYYVHRTNGTWGALHRTAFKDEVDSKQATITGGASTITSSNLTASRALVSDTSGKVAVSAVTSTELGYLDGVTSAIQTQLNGKLSTSGTAASASKLTTTTAGSATQPVYFANGIPKACTYTLEKSVPSDAKFTDTVYTLPTASSTTLGGVKTTSTVTSTSGLTACPIISGVPYYKDTNTTYTLNSFGITATAAELNIMDGVTATAAEINKLDGLTATTTELNYTDGVTSNIQTQLNNKLSLSGGTLTGALQLGTSTTTTPPTVGIAVHDVRDATITPDSFGNKNVNFYFDMIGSKYAGIMHFKGWTGSYAAWELAGNAHNASDNTLYYRQGYGSSWQDWKTIAFTDSSITGNATTSGYVWTCPTTVGTYSRVCSIDSYGSFLIHIELSQSSQVSFWDFIVTNGYQSATITQIGQSGYPSNATQTVRLTYKTASAIYVEWLNSYGYNSATTLNVYCRAIKLSYAGTFTKITTNTSGASSTTIYDSVTTDPRFYQYDKKHLQYGTVAPSASGGFSGTPKKGDIYIVVGS